MAKITKQSLVDARQAIIDIDEEIRVAHEGYRHGATATEAVEFDLNIARLQNKRNRATDAYQNALARVAAAIDKQTAGDGAGEADEA